MSYETLQFDITENVATITLNRPDAANALDLTMAREISDVAIVCDESPEVRVVVITGNGPMFCAGGDLSAFGDAGDQAAALIKQIAGDLHMGISRLTAWTPRSLQRSTARLPVQDLAWRCLLTLPSQLILQSM